MSCDGDERFFNRSGDEITTELQRIHLHRLQERTAGKTGSLGEQLETKDSFSETTEPMAGSQGAEIARSPEGTTGAEVSSELIIKIEAKDRSSLNQQLDRAVTTAQAQAIGEGRRGILVTRHSHDAFSVTLSETVPFGQTLEYRAW